MKVTSPRYLPGILAPISLAVVVALCLCFEAGWNIPGLSSASAGHRGSIHQGLVRRLLLHEHDFVSASDGGFYYAGRWTIQVNHIRRDTSLPDPDVEVEISRYEGAYIEFTVANSSTIYFSLHDRSSPSGPDQHVQPDEVHNAAKARSSLSLVVELTDHAPVHFDETASGTLRIATALDPTTSYRVRATLLKHGGATSASTIGFEGVWLSRGGFLSSSERTSGHSSPAPLQQRPHIEVLSALKFYEPTEATSAYTVLTASALDMSLSQVPVAEHCLTDICPRNTPSIQDIYFHAGRPQGRRFWSSQQLAPSPTAAIVLSLGLLDFRYFLETKLSSQEVDQFIDSFVQTYAEFITTIRLVVRTHHKAEAQYGMTALGQDASYTYNSAPNNMPIFVLTPFTSSRHLRRLLGHATSAVVHHVRSEGDLSTIWIDTEGWLSQHEFQTQTNGTPNHAYENLTVAGHARAAVHLSTHLCPYLKQGCPYIKHDTFGGHLYIPAEAGMGKLLEERKVTLIKELLNIS